MQNIQTTSTEIKSESQKENSAFLDWEVLNFSSLGVVSSTHQKIIDIIYNDWSKLTNSEFVTEEALPFLGVNESIWFRDLFMSNHVLAKQKGLYLDKNLYWLKNINKDAFNHLLSLFISYIPNDGSLTDRDDYNIEKLYDILLEQWNFASIKRLLLSKFKEIKEVLEYWDVTELSNIFIEIKEIIMLSWSVMDIVVKNLSIAKNVTDFSNFLLKMNQNIYDLLKNKQDNIYNHWGFEVLLNIFEDIQLECQIIKASYLHIIDYWSVNGPEEIRDLYNKKSTQLIQLQESISKTLNNTSNKRYQLLDRDLRISECKMFLSFCNVMEEWWMLSGDVNQQDDYLLTEKELNDKSLYEDILIIKYNDVLSWFIQESDSVHLKTTDEVLIDLTERIKSWEDNLVELMNIAFYLYSYSNLNNRIIGEELPVAIHMRKFDEEKEFDMNLEASRFIRMWWRKNVNSKIIQNQQAEHISELKKIKKQLEILATTDQLTELKNRREFEKQLLIKCNQASRLWANSWLIYMDLDGFKWVNDTLWHDMWDKILIEFAHVLKSEFKRPEDIIARLWWDEFTILIDWEKDKVEKKIKELGWLIYSRLNNLAWIKENNDLGLSISIWITGITKTSSSWWISWLIKESDSAMYQVKQDWKNWYMFYGEKSQDFEYKS